MKKTVQQESREQISRFLPNAIIRAMTSYEEFSRSDTDAEGCKDFSARHTAAKAAISHLELLLKLAKWADLPDPAAEDHNNQILLAALMQEAEEDLRVYRENDN